MATYSASSTGSKSEMVQRGSFEGRLSWIVPYQLIFVTPAEAGVQERSND